MTTTAAKLNAALTGRYTIEREIGAGGMATVYLAQDARHKRSVAVKVLNAELGAVLGVERFLAEIQVTANLQHPNLLPLFDSGEASGLLFYVMPYVQGESLRARLLREKQLPVDEALRITTAIAGALDYAHRRKVIHRDLKPENVLMHEGQPLIADFGIALAVSNAGGERVTQTGISLGTPQYMSPEQATGDRVVDGRTDIYSLGAMAYEMLVGDPPHNASTAQSIIAKVLTEKPSSIRISRPNVPAHVDTTVMRALEKLAADRFGTASEFAEALRGKGATTISAAFPAPDAPSRRFRLRARQLPWALSAALGASLAAVLLMRRTPDESQVIRANLDLPPGVRVTDVLVGPTIAMAPKGDVMAFTSVGIGSTATGYRIYVRRVNELLPRAISDVAGRNLTFAANGRFVAFTEGNLLKRVSVDGGQVSTVGTTVSAIPYGLAWSSKDTIYIGSFSGIAVAPASGGSAVPLPGVDTAYNSLGKRWPLLTPDEKGLVFTLGNSTTFVPTLAIMDLATKKVEALRLEASRAIGFLDDQLIYVSPVGLVMAVRFDLSANRVVGEPVQVDDGVLTDPTGGAKASLSASGTLVYLSGRAHFLPVRALGSATPTPLIGEPGVYAYPRYSPTGDRVALTVTGSASTDIRVFHIARNTFERLTTEGFNMRPEWTPDGKRIVFISSRNNKTGIWWQPVDGSGGAELLWEPEVEPFEALVSPDNKWLLVRTGPGEKYNRDILAVPLTGEKKITELVTGPATESMPRFSPDGKWIAYQSTESGRFEIYVRPFPGNLGRVPVSDSGGTEPIWGRDGKSLFYRGPNGGVMQVAVTTGDQFSIGTRKMALLGDYLPDASHANYDVGPDGRFLMLKRAGAESQTIIVHNWGREVREKTARRP